VTFDFKPLDIYCSVFR